MKASELFVECLKAQGVKHIFGLPGEENLDLMDALTDSGIDFILTRHEQAAAFMAGIYGRLTGRAGVCLATLGPGATNLTTGVADANLDHNPLVAVTGQAGLDRVHKESHQYLDVLSMLRPMTKWNTTVHRPENIPEIISKAFKLAEEEKPGATHVELPEDVAQETVEAAPLSLTPCASTEAPEEAIRKAAEYISRARNPIILAGNGVIRGRAWDELLEFAEKLDIPVAHTFMGTGAVPVDHPLCLLTVGLQSRDYISCGFEAADLVVAVGYDFVEYHPEFWNPGRNKRIVHIDATRSEVDASYLPLVEVLGDIALSLKEICRLGKRNGESHGYATALREAICDEVERYREDISFPVKPQRIISDMRSALGKEDILISDVGAHKIWIARMYPCHRPNTCLISNGLAAMGIALPGAVAAKMVYPERRVLAVSGDGGFLMNCQELETALRLGTPFVNLVFNDREYGLISWKQLNKFGRKSGVEFGNPDLIKLAESFGAAGYRVEGPDELPHILEEAFRRDVPAVIDCPVDYSENVKLTEKLGNLVCPI